MPTYSFICRDCETKEVIQLGFEDSKKRKCHDCGKNMLQSFSIKHDMVIRRCATPGQHATRNMQDVQLMNHIRSQREKHKYRSQQTQLQDTVDTFMFRKRGDTPARAPQVKKIRRLKRETKKAE